MTRDRGEDQWRAAERALDRFDAGRSDPDRSDPGRSDPGRSDPGRSDPGRSDPGRSDPGHAATPASPSEASMLGLLELLSDLPPAGWRAIPARPERRRRRRLRMSWRLARLVTAGAVAACFGLGVLVGSRIGGRAASGIPAIHGQEVVLRPLAGGGTEGALAVMLSPGRMLLRVSRLAPSPHGTYYELWLMTNLRHLAPVASFRIGRSGQVQLSLQLPDEPSSYRYLDISLQRLNAGTVHSSDSVLRGVI